MQQCIVRQAPLELSCSYLFMHTFASKTDVAQVIQNKYLCSVGTSMNSLCSVKVFECQARPSVVFEARYVGCLCFFSLRYRFSQDDLIPPVALNNVLSIIKVVIAKGAHCKQLHSILKDSFLKDVFVLLAQQHVRIRSTFFCGQIEV